MDNRKENKMLVEEVRKRSRDLSKHLTKSLMNAIARVQELKGEREQLSDRSKSQKKYKELTTGIKSNKQRAQDLLNKIDMRSPKQIDKLVDKYTDTSEDTYATIPGDTKNSEKDPPLPKIRGRTEKEVSKAVVEANRKFNEIHKGISKEPYANRQPKVKFDEHIYETIPEDTKSSTKGFEPPKKHDHREKETENTGHQLQPESLQKKGLPETRKLTLKDRIYHVHRQKENNSLKHGSHSRSNRPQTSPSIGR